ncbi:MAG: hypothetical protein R2733_19250 [Acidimicrobiales bacterium]
MLTAIHHLWPARIAHWDTEAKEIRSNAYVPTDDLSSAPNPKVLSAAPTS